MTFPRAYHPAIILLIAVSIPSMRGIEYSMDSDNPPLINMDPTGSVGVGLHAEKWIRVNDDDDNHNEVWDYLDSGVIGENDTMEIQISGRAKNMRGSVTVEIKSTNNNNSSATSGGGGEIAGCWAGVKTVTYTLPAVSPTGKNPVVSGDNKNGQNKTSDRINGFEVPQDTSVVQSLFIEGIRHSLTQGDVTISVTITGSDMINGKYPQLTASTTMTVYQVDLDVDSKNDSQFNASGYDDDEDQIEFSDTVVRTVLPNDVVGAPRPGKIVINNNRTDSDSLALLLADGRENLARISTGLEFVPIQLELKEPFDPKTAKVEFFYEVSKPEVSTDGIDRSGSGNPNDPYIYSIAKGGMRLWKCKAIDRESIAPVNANGTTASGDFIPADQQIEWSKIAGSNTRIATLYLEYVDKPSPQAAGLKDITATVTGNGAITDDQVKVNLLPIEMKDIKKVADQNDDVVIEAIPPRQSGESENAYIQRSLTNKQIAYIEPHGAANDIDPEMPHFVAKFHGGPHGLKVRWKIIVEYKRGNGYRASYVQDFTRPEDTVEFPANGAYTAEMDADQEWRIFETQDWIDEIAQNGFFGGTAKLYIWFPRQGAEPTAPCMTFRIGGKNPDQAKAKSFINSVAGTQFWYAYAIARHETNGRVLENGQTRFYNHFYTDYKGGPIGDASTDMGWAAWAKGWPLYNLDRDSRSGPQNGPGGYGMYQLTLGPKFPKTVIPTGGQDFIKRKEIWNWQDNVRGAINELQGKLSYAQNLRDGLQSTYPSSGSIPSYRHFSGLEAIVITYYNGMGGGQIESIQVNGYKKKQRVCWDPHSGGWTFLHNRYVDIDARTGYVYAVDKQVK